MAHRWNSEEAAKARRTRGAYAGHASVRASGRVPGQEARAARSLNAMHRRLAKLLDAAPGYETTAYADQYGAIDDGVITWDGE